MRWLAMVQSTHSQVEEELTWAKVDILKLREAPKFEEMIHREGIPHSLRPFIWPRLCGAVQKRTKSRFSWIYKNVFLTEGPLSYAKILRKIEKESAPAVDVQIEKFH
jgi:hypothetical protein